MQPHLNPLGQPVGFPLPDWKPPTWPTPDAMEGRFCRVVRLDAATHGPLLHTANALDAEGKMWTYLPYGPFASQEAYQLWLEDVARRNDPFFYTLIDLATDRAVGLASYLRIDPPGGVIEVGHLHFSPLLQRRACATEGMFLMMDRAFTQGYRRYEWKCDALNGPSRSAAQRFGFTFEGIFRQATVVKGRNRDTAWFSITDREWLVLKEAFLKWLAPENFDDLGKQRQRLSHLTAQALATLAASAPPNL